MFQLTTLIFVPLIFRIGDTKRTLAQTDPIFSFIVLLSRILGEKE